MKLVPAVIVAAALLVTTCGAQARDYTVIDGVGDSISAGC